MWHGREPAATLVRRYSSSEATKMGGAGLGTVMGVVFPCMANILGVLLFLRLPWIVGKAGILQGFFLVLVCCSCTFVTTLSLSAVATNGKIAGGGSYFLISRSLGPALGAGVGLCFYMANSIGAAMYFMGTVEAWEIAQPDLQILTAGEINNIRVTAFGILVVALIIVAGGVKFVAKLGTVFLFIVLAVIACMYIGCFVGPNFGSESPYEYTLPDDFSAGNISGTIFLEFSSPSGTHFSDNFNAEYDAEQWAFPKDTAEHNFISLMALWFPAVTGIMAGSNRSSDLADPAGSIPKGTLTAQILTSIIYLSFVFLYGAVAPRESLLHDKFFAASSAWPAKEAVTYGVMASTIGAGLTSLVSGSRLLSAIAGDRTLPILSVFAVPPGKEPRLALLASGVLCTLAIAIGELNAVAPVLTMFFLMCYVCVNLSCAVLEAVHDPNWRPTFRFHHWSISLFGAILCLWMMFAMSPLFAGIAMLFCAVIFTYASHNSHQVKWGDGWQGMKFQLARNILQRIDITMHTKNWRPQLLVITEADIAERDVPDADTPEVIVLSNPELLNLASQLKGGRGITIFGGVCLGKDTFGDGGLFVSPLARQRALDGQITIQRLLKKHAIEGFGRMVYVEDFSAGLLSLVQIAGLGAFQPNCVMAAWPKEEEWRATGDKGLEVRSRLIRLVQVSVVFHKVVLLAKGLPFPSLQERVHGTIDIWWIVADGGILLLLPFLLSKHPVWARCRMRLFAVADQTEDDAAQIKTQLETYVRDFRLNVEVYVKMLEVAGEFGAQDGAVMHERAAAENPWLDTGKAVAVPVTPEQARVVEDELPRAQLSSLSYQSIGSELRRWRSGQPDTPDHVGQTGTGQGSTSVRNHSFAKHFPMSPPTSIGRQVSAPATLQDVGFDPIIGTGTGASGVLPDPHAAVSMGSLGGGHSSIYNNSSFMRSQAQISSTKPCTVEEMSVARALKKIIQEESTDAELVVTNLPDMPPGESAYGYFELVEEMTAGLRRTFLVRGTASEVITAFT